MQSYGVLLLDLGTVLLLVCPFHKNNKKMEQEVVNDILSKHGIIKYRDLFSQYKFRKDNMPKSCEHLVKPFSMSEVDTKIKSGILYFV